MKKNLKSIITLAISGMLILFFTTSSLCQRLYSDVPDNSERIEFFRPGVAISLKLSTLGPGIEIVKTLGRKFSLRAGANYIYYNYNAVYEDLNIDASSYLELGAISLLADWYMAKRVHFTGGLMYNLTNESATGKPAYDFSIGNINVTPEKAGSLTINLKTNKLCPYIGLGFGRPVAYGYRVVSFNFDIGVLYHGKPKVDLEAEGMISPTANQENEKIIEDNLSDFYLYPVIAMQLAFKIY